MQALLVKFSSLGDVIHAMPALTDAAEQCGSTLRFDWAVEEAYADLASWHPAVNTVVPIALRRWRREGLPAMYHGLRSYLRDLRTQAYDVVVDAQGLLKSAVLGALPARGPAHGFSAGCAREAASAIFYGSGRHYIAADMHMVERIRHLFARTLNYSVPKSLPDYGIADRFAGERREAVMLLHSSAQQRKLIEDELWVEIGKALAAQGQQVELCWNTQQEKDRAQAIAQGCGATVLPQMDLTAIAKQLATCSGAIGLDSGLTHLAAAMQVPCIGLYTVTDPSRSGNVGLYQASISDKNAMQAASIVSLLAEKRAERGKA